MRWRKVRKWIQMEKFKKKQKIWEKIVSIVLRFQIKIWKMGHKIKDRTMKRMIKNQRTIPKIPKILAFRSKIPILQSRLISNNKTNNSSRCTTQIWCKWCRCKDFSFPNLWIPNKTPAHLSIWTKKTKIS